MSEIKRGPGRPKNPNGRMKIINVRVTDEMHNKIADAANRYGMSMSEFIRNSVDVCFNLIDKKG